MLIDWFKPKRTLKSGWQFRLLAFFIGFFVITPLIVGREVANIWTLVGLGVVIVLWTMAAPDFAAISHSFHLDFVGPLSVVDLPSCGTQPANRHRIHPANDPRQLDLPAEIIDAAQRVRMSPPQVRPNRAPGSVAGIAAVLDLPPPRVAACAGTREQ